MEQLLAMKEYTLLVEPSAIMAVNVFTVRFTDLIILVKYLR
jgi:hypothetical protein